jgi:nucleoside-diphosphate-sugar epimerase
MPVWLVTGGSGFLGRHVLNALRAVPGVDVLALGRRCPDDWPPERFVTADLEHPESLSQAIAANRPDVVIHTAGRTPPGDPSLFHRSNTLATLHLLDALKLSKKPIRVVLAGSAAELGPVDLEALPVGEDHPCEPADAYGLSKWLATCAGLVARAPLEVVSARVFNPVGPGQPRTQALGRFAASLAEGSPDVLVVGGLDARRDFVDVRDVARALIALAERGRPGLVYHVGTGQSHRVGEGLEHMIRRHGRAVPIRVDPGLTSSTGPSDSRADIRRIVEHTGWRPEVRWEQSLDDLWDEAVARAADPLPFRPLKGDDPRFERR